MANYKQPQTCNRRVRFYDGQFLQDQDFIDEQKYHLDRQHRHNFTLHVSGVATGLVVSSNGANEIKVSPGMAIDREGRSLVLEKEQTIEVHANGWLYIAYHQVPEEKQVSSQGIQDDTRWLETPCLFIAGKQLKEGVSFNPDQLIWKSVDPWNWTDYLDNGSPPPLLLAKLSLGKDGQVAVDQSERRYSGLRFPTLGEAPILNADATGAVHLWLPDAGKLSPLLTISEAGKVGIGTAVPKSPLSVSGAAAIGADYATKIAPADGLIIQGQVGIGTTNPKEMLEVNGRIKDQTGYVMPVGTILAYAGRAAPEGWLMCDGQTISLDDKYKHLRDLIGNTTPNLSGRALIGAGGIYSLGQTGGEETHKLEIDEIPSHSHTINNGDFGIHSRSFLGSNDPDRPYKTLAQPKLNTDNTGGGQAHNNMQPYYVVNYIIKY
jgi:microcystin-dependent protein